MATIFVNKIAKLVFPVHRLRRVGRTVQLFI